MKRKKEYVCKVCGRKTGHTDGICSKHFDQIKQYGFPLDDNPRRETDANEIEIKDNHAEIILYDFMEERIEEVVIVDLDVVDKIKGIRWNKKQSCIVGNIKGKNVLLANYLLDTDNKIEYIDGNSLNNRVENLRVIEKNAKVKKLIEEEKDR